MSDVSSAQARLDHALGLDRTIAERFDDHMCTVDKAHAGADRLIRQARAIMAEDPYEAERLLDRAGSCVSSSRHCQNLAREEG